MKDIIQAIATLGMIMAPGIAMMTCFKLLSGYFFKLHWRNIAQHNQLTYEPPTLKQTLLNNNRGTLSGRFEDICLDINIKTKEMQLRISSAQDDKEIPKEIQLETESLMGSLLPGFLKSEVSIIDTEDSSFNKKFNIKGGPVVTTALLDPKTREIMTTLLDYFPKYKSTIRIQSSLVQLHLVGKQNMRLHPESLFHKANELIANLVLPLDASERSEELARRLATQLTNATKSTQRLRLAAALLAHFPTKLDALDILTYLKDAPEPALRWLAKETEQTTRAHQLFVLLSPTESFEKRWQALDTIKEIEDVHALYQIATSCLESNDGEIRREAKKMREKLAAEVANAGGNLSMADTEDQGHVSLVGAGNEGGMSLVPAESNQTQSQTSKDTKTT